MTKREFDRSHVQCSLPHSFKKNSASEKLARDRMKRRWKSNEKAVWLRNWASNPVIVYLFESQPCYHAFQVRTDWLPEMWCSLIDHANLFFTEKTWKLSVQAEYVNTLDWEESQTIHSYPLLNPCLALITVSQKRGSPWFKWQYFQTTHPLTLGSSNRLFLFIWKDHSDYIRS